MFLCFHQLYINYTWNDYPNAMVTEVFNSRTLGSLDKFLFKRNNLVTANYDEVSNKIFSSIFSNSFKNFSIFKIIEIHSNT